MVLCQWRAGLQSQAGDHQAVQELPAKLQQASKPASMQPAAACRSHHYNKQGRGC